MDSKIKLNELIDFIDSLPLISKRQEKIIQFMGSLPDLDKKILYTFLFIPSNYALKEKGIQHIMMHLEIFLHFPENINFYSGIPEYINKFSVDIVFDQKGNITIEELFEILNLLKNGKSIKHKATVIRSLIEKTTPRQFSFILKLITGHLNVPIKNPSKIYNKIFINEPQLVKYIPICNVAQVMRVIKSKNFGVFSIGGNARTFVKFLIEDNSKIIEYDNIKYLINNCDIDFLSLNGSIFDCEINQNQFHILDIISFNFTDIHLEPFEKRLMTLAKISNKFQCDNFIFYKAENQKYLIDNALEFSEIIERIKNYLFTTQKKLLFKKYSDPYIYDAKLWHKLGGLSFSNEKNVINLEIVGGRYGNGKYSEYINAYYISTDTKDGHNELAKVFSGLTTEYIKALSAWANENFCEKTLRLKTKNKKIVMVRYEKITALGKLKFPRVLKIYSDHESPHVCTKAEFEKLKLDSKNK